MNVRSTLLSLFIFGAAFGIYHSNGPYPLGSFDSTPNSLLAFELFSRGRLDFDVLRNGDLVRRGAGYAFVEAPNGHYASIFPIGTAIVTLPLYAAFDAARRIAGRPVDIAAPDFDPVRQLDEKAAATAVAALAVVLFFTCALAMANTFAAVIATVAFAFGTEMWTIGSQALWQHGSVCLVLLAMFASLQRAVRAQGRRQAWFLAAGACAGLLVTIRPTAAVFALAGLAFVAWQDRRGLGPFAFGAAGGVAPTLAWNVYFFHNLLGGYVPNLATASYSPADVAGALAGELFSPNRGLFVFTPLVVFSVIGAVRAARSKTSDAMLVLVLAGASVLLCGIYAAYPLWWGGWCYGPRFLTDTMPIAGLLLLFVIPPSLRAFVRRGPTAAFATSAFALTFAASIGVQLVGANSGVQGPRWNATPRSIDSDPSRVWDAADWQIAWNARAMYEQFAPPGLRPEPPLESLRRSSAEPDRTVRAGSGTSPAPGSPSAIR